MPAGAPAGDARRNPGRGLIAAEFGGVKAGRIVTWEHNTSGGTRGSKGIVERAPASRMDP
jgi:hypothetical protein